MASEATDPGELYSKTDIALYCAKNAGRNCSYAYQDGMQKDFTKKLAYLQELKTRRKTNPPAPVP